METPKFIIDNILHDGLGRLELIQHVGTDKIVVNAARASYGQDNQNAFSKGDKKLLNYLLEADHSSVLEHTYVTFVVDSPLYIAVQWLRHRMSSFNMISRRYVELPDDEFYIPKVHRLQHHVNKQASYMPDPNSVITFADGREMPYDVWDSAVTSIYEEGYKTSMRLYKELLGFGVARESARAILPVGQYTRFYYSANLRSMLHFCDLRLGEGAQWEIQQYAKEILNVLTELYPNTIAAWSVQRENEIKAHSLLKEFTALSENVNSVLDSLEARIDSLSPPVDNNG